MLSYLPTYRSFPSARSSAPTPRPFGQVYLVCLLYMDPHRCRCCRSIMASRRVVVQLSTY